MIENVALTGIVMALCQVVKQYVNTKWIPLMALFLGVVGSVGLHIGQGDLIVVSAIFEGIISGLAASGTYEVATKTFKPQ